MSKALVMRLQMQTEDVPADVAAEFMDRAMLALEMQRAVEAAQVEPEPDDPPLMHLMS
jgi:hypothetical protein